MDPLKVASVQFEHTNGDKAANLETITSFVQQAAEQDVKVILFPECCISGYWFLRKLTRDQLVELAEPIPSGPATAKLATLAQAHDMIVSAGLVELADDGTLYNTQIIAMPDGSIERHRKLHCFVSKHMESGSDYTVFDTPWGYRMSCLICYDNNIIENTRICALKGAQIHLAPHQTGGCETGDPHTMGVIDRKAWDERATNPAAIEAEFTGDKGRGWLQRWLPSRAHDNGMFLLFSNGVGIDDNEVRTGNAMILDPFGRVLSETWKARDEMVIATLDPKLLKTNSGLRWMRSRRPDLYTPITTPTGKEEDVKKVRFFFKAEDSRQ
jgi:N-carbamoylputrescine amidase